MTSLKLKQLFANDPQMIMLLEQRELNDHLKKLAEKPVVDLAREMMKGDKGDKGDEGPRGPQGVRGEKGVDGKDGYTPVRGIDYLTKEDVSTLVQKVISMLPEDKDEFDKDLFANQVVSMAVNEISTKISELEDKVDEKIDAKKVTVDSVIKEIKTKKLLEKRDIKDMRLDDQKWHGGGPTLVAGAGITITSNSNGTTTLAASTGLNSETPVGAVDGVNLVYTVTHTPVFLITDGLMRVSGIDYTYSLGTITMDATIPPVSYIRSIYS